MSLRNQLHLLQSQFPSKHISSTIDGLISLLNFQNTIIGTQDINILTKLVPELKHSPDWKQIIKGNKNGILLEHSNTFYGASKQGKLIHYRIPSKILNKCNARVIYKSENESIDQEIYQLYISSSKEESNTNTNTNINESINENKSMNCFIPSISIPINSNDENITNLLLKSSNSNIIINNTTSKLLNHCSSLILKSKQNFISQEKEFNNILLNYKKKSNEKFQNIDNDLKKFIFNELPWWKAIIGDFRNDLDNGINEWLNEYIKDIKNENEEIRKKYNLKTKLIRDEKELLLKSNLNTKQKNDIISTDTNELKNTSEQLNYLSKTAPTSLHGPEFLIPKTKVNHSTKIDTKSLTVNTHFKTTITSLIKNTFLGIYFPSLLITGIDYHYYSNSSHYGYAALGFSLGIWKFDKCYTKTVNELSLNIIPEYKNLLSKWNLQLEEDLKMKLKLDKIHFDQKIKIKEDCVLNVRKDLEALNLNTPSNQTDT